MLILFVSSQNGESEESYEYFFFRDRQQNFVGAPVGAIVRFNSLNTRKFTYRKLFSGQLVNSVSFPKTDELQANFPQIANCGLEGTFNFKSQANAPPIPGLYVDKHDTGFVRLQLDSIGTEVKPTRGMSAKVWGVWDPKKPQDKRKGLQAWKLNILEIFSRT